MKTVFADTSYYVALVNSSDQHHDAAYEYTKGFEGTSLTTAWVLTELGNFLSRATNRSLFLALLNDLREDEHVTILAPTEGLFERGVDLYSQRLDKDWSLTDCISFVAMDEHGLRDALTLDHHFEQAGFNVLLK